MEPETPLNKINYSVHTDAIKKNLIPPRVAQSKTSGLVYAGEADILNVALFGVTAGQWRAQNPDAKGRNHQLGLLNIFDPNLLFVNFLHFDLITSPQIKI